MKSVWISLCAPLALGACLGTPVPQACGGAAECRISLITGPGDASYVPQALETTAQAFLAPSSAGPGPGAGPSGPTRPGGLRLQLDRTTLSPGSSTPYRVTRNHALGLRGEISRPLGQRLQAYAALSVTGGAHDYLLPQGLGPLTDPMQIDLRTRSLTPEIGLRYDYLIGARSGTSLRLSAGAGLAVTQTQTELRSALVQVSSRSTSREPFVSLAAGLVLRAPGGGQIELASGGRLGKGGRGVLRSELRLSR